MSDLFSFQVAINEEPTGIWEALKKAIARQIKADGIKESQILPGETEQTVFEDALENVYYDVANFYYWIFNKTDDRRIYTLSQKDSAIPTWIRNAVTPTVKDNLDEMRAVGEIPADRDTPELENIIVDTLSRYIVNWEDWYYDRKEDEAQEDYLANIGFYQDIYIDSDYGDLTNISNDEEADFVPYED